MARKKRLAVMKAAREMGVSRAELASRLGISERALSSRMLGNPQLLSLYEISDALNCDVTELFR